MLKHLVPLALLLASPVLADPPAPPQQQVVEAALAKGPKGTHFGLLVVDDTGKVVAEINPDQRFIPASNTKMFTTAAAYALLAGMDRPDADAGTQVKLRSGTNGIDVELIGRGDARMSSAPDCKVDCLAGLADAVAARTRRVHDIVGEDRLWPDQRWVPGMSWNNIGTDSGTAVSALSLDDNELKVTVTPAGEGQSPAVVAPPYYTLTNEAVTVGSASRNTLTIERAVNGFALRLYGEIPSDATPWIERLGVDDPAHYAAWTFRQMLEARGVKVTGRVRVRHLSPGLADRPCAAQSTDLPVCSEVRTGGHAYSVLQSLVPAPLSEDIVTINKVSQNHHAQILFRRLGDLEGTGSEEWSAYTLNKFFEKIGIPREGYDFSDGSGMSTYNRVSPRAGVALLRWIDGQPWGKAWYASLPIAGVDGTLKRRFVGTPLANNLTAKTGTLNATNALSGTFRAASGKRLTFSFFANDVPNGASAIPAMEAVLLALYAAN